MKKFLVLIPIFCMLLFGCSTASGVGTGAVLGGLTGAGIGAIAGDPTAGALIGAGVGGAVGAGVGHHNEQEARRQGLETDVWGNPVPRPRHPHRHPHQTVVVEEYWH